MWRWAPKQAAAAWPGPRRTLVPRRPAHGIYGEIFRWKPPIWWWLIVVFIGYKPTTMGIWWWSGWWWLEHDWIMTFQKKLEIRIPTDELHHFSEGWVNHQPAMVTMVISSNTTLCYGDDAHKTCPIWKWSKSVWGRQSRYSWRHAGFMK